MDSFASGARAQGCALCGWREALAERGFQIAIGLFCLIHLSLLVYDINRPDAFLTADRGGTRLAKIEALRETVHNGGSLSEFFVATGSPGDYLYQGVVYGLVGRQGLVIVHLGLALVGITYLYLLARLLTGSRRVATLATILYLLLPASIQFPHILGTEAFSNPLLIISVYYLVCYLQGVDHKFSSLAWSGMLLALASTIRLIALPIAPLILLILLALAIRRQVRLGHVIIFAVTALIIPMAVMTFYYFQTGSFSTGESDHSIGRNLAQRIARISHMEGIDPQTILAGRREVDASDYLVFVSTHPVSYAKILIGDGINLLGNSGINSLFGRYLDATYFMRMRDRGIADFIITVLAYSPMLTIINVLSLILWLLFLVAAAWGLSLLARDPNLLWSVRLTFVGLIAYFVLVSQLGANVGYRHRTPIEFDLVIAVGLAVVTWLDQRAHPVSSH